MSSQPTGREPWTPVRIDTISVTERSSFRKDRRQWFLHDVHRLEGPGAALYLTFGTAMHGALETYHSPEMEDTDPIFKRGNAIAVFDALWSEAMAKAQADEYMWQFAEKDYLEHETLGRAMLEGYVEADKAASIMTDYPPLGRTLATEQRFTAPIPGTKGKLTGKLDLITEPAPGQKRGMDHKNLSTQNNPADLDLDDQLTAYAWLYRAATGQMLDSVGHNVLLKKHPLTKSGKPTTSRLFIRDIAFRSDAQLEEFEYNLTREWLDMQRVAAHPEWAYPNNTAMNSRGCPVHSICRAMALGDDVEAVIRDGYVIGDPRE